MGRGLKLVHGMSRSTRTVYPLHHPSLTLPLKGRGPDIKTIHRAFTLVELLVVIAIIGGLVALLLPAVQAAREASRRSRCQNNLRQVGIALAAHEERADAFPMGCLECKFTPPEPGEPFKPQRFTAWTTHLLPHLEQQALYDAYDFEVPAYAPPNRTVGSAELSVLLCPSTEPDLRASTSNLWRGMAFTDYGGVYGIEGPGHDNPDLSATQGLNDQSIGVMVYEEAIAAREVPDGLSRTVAVAEMLHRREAETEWASGQNLFAQGASTPVNGDSGLGNDIGSPHPGGASAAFCDGHVAFLPDETPQEIFNALLTRAGEEQP
jgi:prepilin-type N-terminal cleavage/methylation domain-containing protein/prepilin-type processing-associated H-X9-DG protein